MVRGRIVSNPKDLSNARILIEEIVCTELEWSRAFVENKRSDMSIYAVVYEDEQEQMAVAAGWMTYDGDACKVEAIGVRKEHRRKGYGDFILRLLVNKAFTSGIKEVECVVPIDLAPFFKKIGFQIKREEVLDNGKKCKLMSIMMADFVRPCRK